MKLILKLISILLRNKNPKVAWFLSMRQILSKRKALALLLFLFGYTNLFAQSGSSACSAQERIRRDVISAHKLEICKERSKTIEERVSEKYSFIYLKIPELTDEYLEYPNEDLAFNLESDQRKEKALPIYIEFNNGEILNPLKSDREKYKVSSKIREQIISENLTISRRNCTFMALGSEYLFPVPAQSGILTVILYFDYSKDMAPYTEHLNFGYRYNRYSHFPENYFGQFVHRGLKTKVKFEINKIYQIEIAINPNSALPRGSYNATSFKPFQTAETVPGFSITLKELPPNTKFAFDGKDDIGKTYEQVKKEFILYDHTEEAKKE